MDNLRVVQHDERLRGGLLNASNLEYRNKSILLLDVTHADPQAQVHVRTGSADHDKSAASTSKARKRQRYTRPDMHPSTSGAKN